MPKITRPTSLSEYAELTLQSVADAGLGQKLSLGGALGLQHYLEYRSTHDVDAWWKNSTSSIEREQVFEAVEETLRPFGPWLDFAIDSLPDLIASKMVALVERGAPRDFLDIYTLCQREIVTPTECWRLWKERQERADSDASPDRARLAVESHLGRIARHRSLESIADPDQRRSAEALRRFFSQEFLDALVA